MEKVSCWKAGGNTQIPATTVDVWCVHVLLVSVIVWIDSNGAMIKMQLPACPNEGQVA